MKKFFAIVLVVTALLSLVACSGNQEVVNTTVPGTTEHPHIYSSEVTLKATCTEKGKEVFTCACGHTTTEEIPATGHTWGEWRLETPALIGKDGVEKRFCTACSESETKKNDFGAVENSFEDIELQYVIQYWNGVNGDVTAYAMLAYFSQKYEQRESDPLVVPAQTMYDWLSKRFTLTDALKEEMKQSDDFFYKYHAATDTFELTFAGSCGGVQVLGYIPGNENNKYTVYYEYISWEGDDRLAGVWEVSMEYNLVDGKPNKYLSVMKVNGVPDKVIG